MKIKKKIPAFIMLYSWLFSLSIESNNFLNQHEKTLAEAVSLEEYDALSKPSVPTVYSYTSAKNQQLFYVGTCHDSNSNHAQYATLDKQWKMFLEQTEPGTRTVISETVSEDTVYYYQYRTRTDAITYGGDCGYATWLGQTHNIPVIGAELTHTAVIQQLLKEFNKNEVYYFCFTQAADFWSRYKETPQLEPFILERVHRWTQDTRITFKQLTDLHETYTGKAFSTPNRNFFVRLMTLTYHTSYLERGLTYFSIPTQVLNVIYPLLRRSHQIRDTHSFAIIKKEWDTRKNLFVVYGALHAIALKKQLELLTQQQSSVFHQEHTAR